MIARKLEFWREGGADKHLRDVRAMLASGTPLDGAFLAREIDQRSVRGAWAQVSDAGEWSKLHASEVHMAIRVLGANVSPFVR